MQIGPRLCACLRDRTFVVGVVFAALVWVGTASDAVAQEGAKRALEEVVVTARRREESLQSVPIAVTALSSQDLAEAGAFDLSEIQSEVPNLSIYPGRNQSTTLTVFMRGVGQADPLWGVDPGVGLYLDDVYIARPQGALLDVFNVDRIEVLRGPQGTLYGKNTIGGAIKYVSKPLSDEFEANISATVGEFSTQEIRGSVSGAFVPGVFRASAAVASLQRDGYGKNLFLGNDVSDKDTLAFRLAAEWTPTDDLSFKLAYDRSDDDANPRGYARLEANPNCLVFLGEPCEPLPNNFDVEAGLEPLNGTEMEGTSLTVQWDLNDTYTVKSITAFRESDSENNIDFDTTPARITDVVATYFDEQFTQELQLLFDNGDNLQGIVGLFYLDGEAGGLVQNIFFDALFGTTDGDTNVRSIAAFGDLSYALSDRFTLSAGLRYTDEEKCGRAFNAGYSDDTFTEVIAVTADYDDCTTFTSTSPRVVLDYAASDAVLLYGSVSRGFKSGGYNVRAQSTAFPESALPFDNEELTMYELGAKTTLFDNQVTFNAALFYGDYTDVQVSTFEGFDSDGDGEDDAFFGNFQNAGDATVQGIETEFVIAPEGAPWLTIDGNINYLDAEPDEFLDRDENEILDTQVITNAPEFTAAINGNLTFDAWGGEVFARLGYSYRDESVLTTEGVDPLVQDSFSLVNAALGYNAGDGAWRVMVHGKNLGDEEYITNGYNIPVLGIRTGAYGMPRTLTLTADFFF